MVADDLAGGCGLKGCRSSYSKIPPFTLRKQSTPQINPSNSNPIRIPMATPSQDLSWRSAPTKTPTPQTEIGPAPSNTPSIVVVEPEKRINIEWDKVDYVDFSIDALGIIGDTALIFVEPGPGLVIDAVVSLAEVAGAGKTMYEVYQKDYSGVSTFTLNTVLDMVEKNPVIAARIGRVAPLIGIVGNIYSMYTNLNPQLIPTTKE